MSILSLLAVFILLYFTLEVSQRPASINELSMMSLKISEAVDITAARAVIEEAAESLSLFRSLRHITTIEGRDQLVQAATSFYLEGRTKKALQQ